MRKIIAVVLLLASFNMIYAQKESEEKSVENDFGILELFIDTPLYRNRYYFSEYRGNQQKMSETEYEWNISKSADGNKLTVNEAGKVYFELHKTRIVGKFAVKKFFAKEKDTKAQLLYDGSLELKYTTRFSKPTRMLFSVAGLSLKIVESWQDDLKEISYYETIDEHLNSGDRNPSLLNNNSFVLAIGETRAVGNKFFRFVSAKDSKVKITLEKNESGGSASLILYDSNGKVIKEADGGGELHLYYIIPEDGFYYITTLLHNGNFRILTLNEE